MKFSTTLRCSSLMVLAASIGGAAIAQEETLEGSFVLPNVDQEVSGEMVVQETGPLSRQLELTYFNLDTGEPISRFDVELTQQHHVLATDSALSRLIHQHVEAADEEGRFTTEIAFPEPGLYNIYTDAVPSGLGQQVLRFDIQVGDRSDENSASGTAMTGQPANVAEGPIAAFDDGFTVVLDASQLVAGQEGTMSLVVEKSGEPATDLEPYLGVAAHAVLVRAEDLTYVHAHAMGYGNHSHEDHGSMEQQGHMSGRDHEPAATAHNEHGAG